MICVVFVFNGVNFLQIKKTNTLKNRLKVLVLVVTSTGLSPVLLVTMAGLQYNCNTLGFIRLLLSYIKSC